MERESRETASIENDMSDLVLADLDSAVKVELETGNGSSEEGHHVSSVSQALFHNEEEGEEEDEDDSDDDSGTDHFNSEKSGTQLQRCERAGGGNLPDTFQTSHLLFYERFKAYQDYMLGDCKPSEVKTFTVDYLEKVLEPCDWLALWSTDVFDVLVEVRPTVTHISGDILNACVRLVLPLQCETKGCELTEDAMKSLLEATQHKVPLQQLQVVYEESGDFDQTALALEHLRFFYKHIWRQWDEEDEDDDFDYFVRCVEPRLRLYYDMLEDRVPAGLVAEYQSLLEKCSQCFQQFSVLRSSLSTDSDSELDNVSMVEGLKLCDQVETFKRKLHIIENPLLRYVLAYKGNARQQCVQSRGPRESGVKVVHVVTASCSSIQLQSLLSARLMPLCSSEDAEIQFHREPVSAVDSCHQGDVVIVLPGIYSVNRSISIPDSITVEGFGFPDEVVIEKKTKGDSFVESTGADVRLSNIKFIQHDAIEGILCVRQGTLNMENCVLQCETTGVIVRTSARLTMNMCDLYGSKGAGVEIYPGSVCSLVGNGIHHCKDGILIKVRQGLQRLLKQLECVSAAVIVKSLVQNHYLTNLLIPKDPAAQTGEDKKTDLHFISTVSTTSSSIATSTTTTLTSSSSAGLQPEPVANNSIDGDTASSTGQKWPLSRQLSRNKEMSCSRAVEDLMDHQIFVSIQGNQFKRNGMGDFGTFFY
uniref:Right handed beta helix domain-containing protein n=1 Tax=Amphiprion ocellaris TaxID=80972 RepID=A0AAQ5YVN5_AMPOC